MPINPDMTIAAILHNHPQAAQILRNFGMHCLGCAVASGESLKQAAEVHGIDLAKLLEALEKEAGHQA